ncbi:unnamed protein product, partial [Iphiclides podalirius]
MKIPETSANIGAYYGNDENGQWQPNGVIIDNGVGGGVVGSGDAGVHRPPVYPVHIPRGHHIPGYVMAGAYYPPAPYPPVPPAPQDDFADYMWMENEEEFDKQVMQQLEEEALMEQCIEAMLEDEQRERHRPVSNGHNHHYPTTSNGQPSLSLEEAVSRSTLNPLAAEFVPTRARPPATDEDKQSTEDKVPEEAQSAKPEEVAAKTEAEDNKEVPEESKIEETPSVPSETPEVSAADVQPISERKPREPKRQETKKPVKQTGPKAKPLPARADPKPALKKKEQKPPKPETRVEEKQEEAPPSDLIKQSPPPAAEEVKEGPKPVNYAAAARAVKPRKPSSPPPAEGASPGAPKAERGKPQPQAEKRDKPKVDKPAAVQRKNSAK